MRVEIGAVATTIDVGVALARDVVPPASDADFVLPAPTIVVLAPEVREGSMLLVEPARGGPTNLMRLTRETLPIVAQPGTEYRFERRDPDGVRVEKKGTSSGKGESPAPIRLTRPEEPAATPCELLIAVQGADVDRVGVGIFRAEARSKEVTAASDAVVVDRVARVALPGPGAWRIVARPGTPWAQRRGFFVEQTTTVEARADAPSRWTLQTETGGRVRIDLRDREGRSGMARFRVLREGTPVPAEFAFQLSGTSAPISGVGGLVHGVVDVTSALPPGEYVLEVRSAGKTSNVAFAVVAGEETLVEATAP